MTARINRSAVKSYTLSLVATMRPHLAGKKTRVSASFLERADAALANWIRNEVASMSSTGKTIK